jgi:hypothetical protein
MFRVEKNPKMIESRTSKFIAIEIEARKLAINKI